MTSKGFFARRWPACLAIWFPQAVATIIAAFLFHRLSDCPNCLNGLFTNPLLFNFKNNSDLDGSLMYVTSVLYVCMFVAAVVIFISNLLFLREIPLQAIKQATTDTDHQTMSVYHSIAFYLTIGILITLTIWGIKLIFSPDFLMLGPRSDEYIALGLFVLFCIIDSLFFMSSVVTIRHLKSREAQGQDGATQKNLQSLALTRRLFLDTLWYVDVPVVLGVSMVLLLSAFSEDHFGSLGRLTPQGTIVFRNALGLDQQKSIFSIFVVGISAGATVTHLVVSQFIFGVLRTRDLYRRWVLDT